MQARELDAHIARDGTGSLPILAGIPIGIKVGELLADFEWGWVAAW